MVAWIRSDTKLAQETNTTHAFNLSYFIVSYEANSIIHSRFHVSQDRHFIYVTVATYSQKYLKYLVNGKSSKRPSFLTMDQYGPWDTTDVRHMRQLGPILLAITLRAESESQQEKSEDEGKTEGEEESDEDSEDESEDESDEDGK